MKKRLACLLLLSSCADEPVPADAIDAAVDPDASAGVDAGAPESLPPTSPAELLPWLEAGHYRDWVCESQAHDARPPGAHGSTRICSNALLAGAGPSGAFPVGAAAVKELVGGDSVYGWAVSVKTAASGATG